MAEPRLEIEKRVDQIELAIRTLAQQMVEKKSNYHEEDAERIARILDGEHSKEE